jgi:hypothetical protein
MEEDPAEQVLKVAAPSGNGAPVASSSGDLGKRAAPTQPRQPRQPRCAIPTPCLDPQVLLAKVGRQADPSARSSVETRRKCCAPSPEEIPEEVPCRNLQAKTRFAMASSLLDLQKRSTCVSLILFRGSERRVTADRMGSLRQVPCMASVPSASRHVERNCT